MINDYERRLDRKQSAAFLTERGYRTAPATLAKLVVKIIRRSPAEMTNLQGE